MRQQRRRFDFSQLRITRGALILAALELGLSLVWLLASADARLSIDQYLTALERSASDDLLERTDRDRRGYYDTQICRVEIADTSGGPADVIVSGQPATITVDVTEEVPALECRLTIADSLGQPVTSMDSEISAPADVREPGRGTRLECQLASLPLLPGRYRIDVLLKAGRHIQDGLQAAGFFDVQPGVIDGRPVPPAGADGSIVLPHAWRLPS